MDQITDYKIYSFKDKNSSTGEIHIVTNQDIYQVEVGSDIVTKEAVLNLQMLRNDKLHACFKKLEDAELHLRKINLKSFW